MHRESVWARISVDDGTILPNSNNNLMTRKKKMLIDRPDEIAVPEISYKIVSEVDQQTQFKGPCVPIPVVLLEYLTKSELKLFSIILKTYRDTGRCTLRLVDFGKKMGVTPINISNMMGGLQRMGIISNTIGYGRKRNKEIHFDAIQKLHDYLEDMKPGAPIALRAKMKQKDISNIPPSIDLYMQANYAYSDDEVENEEYD